MRNVNDTIRVKVCGIADDGSARAAAEAGADYLGLVFAASPRRVSPQEAERLVAAVPAAWVGVFVDPDPDIVVSLVDRLDLTAVQLHGGETPETCRRLRAAIGRPVWKAVPWDVAPTAVEAYATAVDLLLVDAAGGTRPGGTGRALPWEALAERLPAARRPLPIFLAGGLGPDNVSRAIEIVSPAGVDASSRLERAPGEKDPRLVRGFVSAARDAAVAARKAR